MAMIFKEQRSTKPRALVVDDSQIARYVLSDMLERLGLEVEVADSAEIGLQKIRESDATSRFDLVFMDYLLPGIDGLEAVRRLRSREATKSLPVVMYTSEDSLEFRNRAGDAGADDVFVKTARQEALAVILKRIGIAVTTNAEAPREGNVIPMHGSPAARAPDPGGVKLLARALEAHHAALRSDLLAEFAILERHEEKMRAEVAARVNLVARHMVGQFKKSTEVTSSWLAAERRNAARRGWTQAAVFVLAITLALGLAWRAGESNSVLETRLAATAAALEAQSRTIEGLREELRADGVAAAPAPTARETAGVPTEASLQRVAATPSAASALVGEIQSMGIMGRIRIETDAGTFCVGAAREGYRIEGGNLAFSECEPLPIAPQTIP